MNPASMMIIAITVLAVIAGVLIIMLVIRSSDSENSENLIQQFQKKELKVQDIPSDQKTNPHAKKKSIYGDDPLLSGESPTDNTSDD